MNNLITVLRRRASARLNTLIGVYKTIVIEYGVSDAQIRGSAGHLSDFKYFCFTKSCRSLIAIQACINVKCYEDALIILRSVYENYLHFVYIENNPEEIDEFVHKKVAIAGGLFSYATSKKGNIDKRHIINPETGDVMTYGIGIGELAKGSANPLDALIHTHLFSFLSDYVHTHMITIPNYLDDNHYLFTYERDYAEFQAHLLTIYVAAIFLKEARNMDEFEANIMRRITFQVKGTVKLLREATQLLEIPDILVKHLEE